ncbi:mCG145632, partial [Mus musculus]
SFQVDAVQHRAPLRCWAAAVSCGSSPFLDGHRKGLFSAAEVMLTSDTRCGSSFCSEYQCYNIRTTLLSLSNHFGHQSILCHIYRTSPILWYGVIQHHKNRDSSVASFIC